MVLRKTIMLLGLALLSIAGTVDQSRMDKKIQKALEGIWPEQSPSSHAMASIHVIGEEQVFEVKVDGITVGYYILDKAKSKFDLFDYMVVFDLEGQILQPQVLVYREDYGGEICSKRWLKQFIGLDAKSDMRLGHEVQNISGATISCEAASRGFKIASERIKAIIDG